MLTLVMTKGLPGSGKSTWAREQQTAQPDKWVLCSKDDLRAMLHQGRHTKANERLVCELQEQIVLAAFKESKSVILHDTGLNPVHEKRFRELVSVARTQLKREIEFRIQDFTHVPVDVCIAQDLKRLNSVGAQVILDMHKKWLAPKVSKVPQRRAYDPAKADCIIVDVDGTLAWMADGGRGPYDWHRVGEDLPDHGVIELVQRLKAQGKAREGHRELTVFVVSGRDGSCFLQTAHWLAHNGIPCDTLFLRSPGDNRKDAIVKREIFETQIEPKFNVLAVLDDRDQTVAGWRDLGLLCLQVAPGDF